jgi:adenine deaminase
MVNLKEYIDLAGSAVIDRREMRGEVIKIPIKEDLNPMRAVQAVAQELANFMEIKTGRGYEPAIEVGQPNEMLVRESGHQYYGLKVFSEGKCVYVSRIAILEDETIFKQYVDHLHFLLSEDSTT